jgi:diguanylate cyclase (GGDEF)-like protein
MGQPLRILFISDSTESTSDLLQLLRHGGYIPVWQRVNSFEAFTVALTRHPWDVVLADVTVAQLFSGAVTELLDKSKMNVPFISLSAATLNGKGQTADSGLIEIADDNAQNLLRAIKHKTDRVNKCKQGAPVDRMLRYLTEYDPLTNLPNRSHFRESLRRSVESNCGTPPAIALLVLGLDRFREINHTLGPKNGDLLLREVARRFEDVSNGLALTARLGGDEFAAIIPRTQIKDIGAFCSRIVKTIEAPFVIHDLPIDLSGSVGVVLVPEHGQDVDLLFQRANIALELAKQSGRGYVIYEPTTDPYSQQKLVYLGGMRNAIEQDQLVLYYQPKIDLQSCRVRGVEALVRWNHPHIGLVPPNEFIYIAERTGLIHALSRWVLRTALDQCEIWRNAGLEITVAVNLSPRNFHDHQLTEYIAGVLHERGLPPRCLEIEITETMIMGDSVHVLAALTRLSEMGVRVYIDDFGTGYSSLGHLKKLPVWGIKIDKSFVSEMTRDENDAVIVRSTIDLGHNLGLEVVAEGVESPEIWGRLSGLGCDGAQGYYMSRPKPPEELDRWFSESPWGINASLLRRKNR